MQQDNKTIKERLADFLAYKGIGQDKFAQQANLSRGFANNVGDSIRQASLEKIKMAFPELNTPWLTTGVGDMLNKERTTEDIQEGLGSKSGYVTYLLPMSAMGGSLTGFAESGVTLQNCEAVISPIENVDFAITVYGESMAPEYQSGSRILIKKINPSIFIEWGKAYVLDTPNGVIVKEIHKCEEKPGFITCHSINPDPKFSDFEVPMGEIYGMYRVLMCLSAK